MIAADGARIGRVEPVAEHTPASTERQARYS